MNPHTKAHDMYRENDRLRAENERLRAALRPFASQDLRIISMDELDLTREDFIRAKEALGK